MVDTVLEQEEIIKDGGLITILQENHKLKEL
jgi:hypothetical protein